MPDHKLIQNSGVTFRDHVHDIGAASHESLYPLPGLHHREGTGEAPGVGA
jgi:hypothetical protein